MNENGKRGEEIDTKANTVIPQHSREFGSRKTSRMSNPRMLRRSFNEKTWIRFRDIEKLLKKKERDDNQLQ